MGFMRSNGGALFNWRLLQLPVRLVDYVIVHELTHLIEPHHGPTSGARRPFHADWRERREELRRKAQMYFGAGQDDAVTVQKILKTGLS